MLHKIKLSYTLNISYVSGVIKLKTQPKDKELKGLVNLQKKTFLKLLLIEKPVMREIECRKPHQKIQNSYKVMKVSKFNQMKICERLI